MLRGFRFDRVRLTCGGVLLDLWFRSVRFFFGVLARGEVFHGYFRRLMDVVLHFSFNGFSFGILFDGERVEAFERNFLDVLCELNRVFSCWVLRVGSFLKCDESFSLFAEHSLLYHFQNVRERDGSLLDEVVRFDGHLTSFVHRLGFYRLTPRRTSFWKRRSLRSLSFFMISLVRSG